MCVEGVVKAAFGECHDVERFSKPFSGQGIHRRVWKSQAPRGDTPLAFASE
jgi:hypothetical protein